MYDRDSLMVSVSGVRGILGVGMNPEVAARFAAAYISLIEGESIVIGRDSRPSGPALSAAVSSVLRFNGYTVIDLGIASTPTVEIMVRESGASGGVIITASHNGPRWNALKFLNASGEFLGSGEMEKIINLVKSESPLYEEPEKTGGYVENDTGDASHIRRILELERIDREIIASRGFSAVVDCVNGAGSRIVPALLRSLGVTVKELFTDVESPFPHDPEPRPENLWEISEAVVLEGADIGFACDPDADRLVMVDNEGHVCSEELTLSVAADFILKHERGPVTANLSTTRLVDDICSRYGVPLHRSRVGEINVVSMMKETKSVIGGEGNGGVIYPGLHYGRDAMVGMALVLQHLSEENITLKELVAGLPGYSILKEKISFSGRFEDAVEGIQRAFHGRCNSSDGIRIDMDEGWIHLRRSNTEPVVRIIAEAVSDDEVRSLIERARDVLDSVSGNIA